MLTATETKLTKKRASLSDSNKVTVEDRPAHDWYRFVLSFPPHLVREYLGRFKVFADSMVLDPFCGTGTTVVECKKQGVASIGVEAHPLSHFAGTVKTNWSVSAGKLRKAARAIADKTMLSLESEGIIDEPQSWMFCEAPPPGALRSLPEESLKLILANSISPLPLHKTLVLLEAIERHATPGTLAPMRLALARALVTTISNLHFGPEVGVTTPKEDAPVVSSWLRCVESMADDLELLHPLEGTPCIIHHGDARSLSRILKPGSIDAVITSPPYPNEKDYTRTTRLESVMLGFIRTKQELQDLKRGKLLRSNTRNVYKGDADDLMASGNPEVQRLMRAIEERRIELGKTSGFERLYARVTGLYFGGMARHFADLRPCLRPGARLAYVVGDQASFLRVMIRTGQILGQLAEELGYEVESIDLFRTRLATATREQLREEVLVLRWPG
ncbi:MAG: hypothetical protein CJBNEKGG_03220 [Prosthecobacter sp.]|nr:hypothetical protein [Prosthecobacter sp.]